MDVHQRFVRICVRRKVDQVDLRKLNISSALIKFNTFVHF